jgi:hypothetical protein
MGIRGVGKYWDATTHQPHDNLSHASRVSWRKPWTGPNADHDGEFESQRCDIAARLSVADVGALGLTCANANGCCRTGSSAVCIQTDRAAGGETVGGGNISGTVGGRRPVLRWRHRTPWRTAGHKDTKCWWPHDGRARTIRRLLREAGFKPSRPFAKAQQWAQPLYGREAVA